MRNKAGVGEDKHHVLGMCGFKWKKGRLFGLLRRTGPSKMGQRKEKRKPTHGSKGKDEGRAVELDLGNGSLLLLSSFASS